MQQRRFRPGDVVDDYCPRERRITDHAVVAMIDDNIKQTRCCVCDAEHQYKDGKVPVQRRKKPQAALFTQVLEGLQGPQAARLAQPDVEIELPALPDLSATAPPLAVLSPHVVPVASNAHPAGQDLTSGNRQAQSHGATLAAAEVVAETELTSQSDGPPRDEGPVRRSLIRATLPRPEGQQPPARALPEFTIRQPNNGRARPGGRRRGGGGQQRQGQGHAGPMRFGRGGGHGQGQGQGQGQGHGQRQHGRNPGPHGGRGSRRGGKKR